jgi:hypothetical protein
MTPAEIQKLVNDRDLLLSSIKNLLEWIPATPTNAVLRETVAQTIAYVEAK